MSGEGPFQRRFRALARDRLATIRTHVEALAEGEGDAAEHDADLRREIHTMKGEARIVGLSEVAQALHDLEEVLHQDGPLERSVGARIDAIAGLLDGTSSGRAAAPVGDPTLAAAGGPVDALLRVDVASLSRIARAIGELRVGEADLLRVGSDLAEIADHLRRDEARTSGSGRLAADLRRLASRLEQIAFDQHVRLDQLVEHVRQVRMVPLAQLFEPFPRAARELAADLGKELDVIVRGADVQVDRQVLDVIAEPMLHLVRNAVDHGLETPDERRAMGKSARGTLELAAVVEGSHVRISVGDDGRGVDVVALREALEARGVDPGEVAALVDAEILELLCRRGLSTRRIVSEVSGRGVGLDVVKRRVESVGGRLALRTIVGAGATFTLDVPMSALLAPMLCARSDDARYALAPEDVENVEEVRAEAIELLGSGLVMRVGEVPVPLHDLATLLGTARRDPRERASALVVRAGERRIALAVDRVEGTVPVLQQRLDAFLEGAAAVRSVALLATGTIAVALDVGELLRRADSGTSGAGSGAEGAPGASIPARRRRVLVADDSELTRDVVVAALRELDVDVIEAVDGRSALELVASKRPDVVLTDLDMPVVDGFELLRRIRSEPAWASLPVIVLSTRWAPADLKRASELGADAYLVKNRIELEEVRRVIGAHLATGREGAVGS